MATQITTTPQIRRLVDGLWAVASQSEPGTDRLVKRGTNGSLTCDCPHGFFHADEIATGKRCACRHVKAVVAFENERQARIFGTKDSDFNPPHPKRTPDASLGLFLITGGRQGAA